MIIGITGGNGFIGWHLRCYLKTIGHDKSVRVASRETFISDQTLSNFVSGCDVIFHLAGVNRPTGSDSFETNRELALKLVNALKQLNSKAIVIYASSTLSDNIDSEYGKEKYQAGQILKQWAERSGGGKAATVIIPHVFGEYGRPFYNSAVATFCHQVTRCEPIEVNRSGQLELIHVQDLVEKLFEIALLGNTGEHRICGHPISVGSVSDKILSFYQEYIVEKKLPDLADKFNRDLFNTFRGALPDESREVVLKQFSDDRGWLVETVKVQSTGQCFVSTTVPDITRGNHYHRRKFERFLVLQGTGKIKLRKLFSDKVIAYDLDGANPGYVDIPTLHTHNITNTGSTPLITLFWSNEIFDQDNPDTFAETV